MTKLNGKKVFCIITGASQGIGRTIAIEFSKLFHSNSEIKLTARSKNGLQSTSNSIRSINKDIATECIEYDLSNPNFETFKDLVKPKKNVAFDIYVLVHNAGSEGDSKLTKDMSNLQEWQSYMTLNFFSMSLLTSAFLEVNPSGHRLIINITSLAAVQPFKSLGYYCVGKAAREMYLRTLAEENKDLDILNYSPGPVATDMVDRLITKVKDGGVKESFVSMRDNQALVKSENTVAKLIAILEQNKYTSGGRVDYFDN
ncbi:hypothetical protein O3M35_011406 [Rhynocoris fuscipes]|uniref:Sepiapterin reductase n=1 Tax=Rhynocoris fuscipes TaxID=488301 RepID=A0AAW1D2A3_9HEMI